MKNILPFIYLFGCEIHLCRVSVYQVRCPSSMMASGYLISAPVCFIENAENENLLVRKEAQDILIGINEPVVVVSIVGLYPEVLPYEPFALAGQQSGETRRNFISDKACLQGAFVINVCFFILEAFCNSCWSLKRNSSPKNTKDIWKNN